MEQGHRKAVWGQELRQKVRVSSLPSKSSFRWLTSRAKISIFLAIISLPLKWISVRNTENAMVLKNRWNTSNDLHFHSRSVVIWERIIMKRTVISATDWRFDKPERKPLSESSDLTDHLTEIWLRSPRLSKDQSPSMTPVYLHSSNCTTRSTEWEQNYSNNHWKLFLTFEISLSLGFLWHDSFGEPTVKHTKKSPFNRAMVM